MILQILFTKVKYFFRSLSLHKIADSISTKKKRKHTNAKKKTIISGVRQSKKNNFLNRLLKTLGQIFDVNVNRRRTVSRCDRILGCYLRRKSSGDVLFFKADDIDFFSQMSMTVLDVTQKLNFR
jgi:hypothetical protein